MHSLTRPGPRPPVSSEQADGGLVGRSLDLAVAGAFIAALPGGGGALLLTGEPGVGKSALLAVAAEQAAAAGLRVLRAAGAQPQEMAYGTLNELLLPLRGVVSRLGNPQRDVLNVALGFRDGPACDRLLVSNAVLELLGRVAGGQPVLLVVDNLDWVDEASGRVLGFVARRLRGIPAGLLAAQPGGPAADLITGLPRHEVRPLGDDASSRLVTLRSPDLAPVVRRRIVAEARGNPLALLELPAGLSWAQRTGLAALPTVLPLSGRLRATLLARLAAVPPATASLLVLAVLEGTGDLALLREAAGGQWGIDDLAPAVQAGLVQVDDANQRLVFAHPAIRSGVLETAPGAAVRQAHLALAAQLGDQPERRAWHLAGAAIERNGRASGSLAQAPRPRNGRDDDEQARQYATAAYLTASVLGDLGAAESLLADARLAEPGAGPSAEAAFATAFVLLQGDGDVAGAHRLVLRGLEAVSADSTGPLAIEQALWILIAVCRLTGRTEHWESLERLISAARSAVPASVRAAARTLLDPPTEPARPPAGIEAPAAPAEPAEVVQLALAASFADRLTDWRQALRSAARPQPGGSTGAPALQAGILLALEAFQTGQWDEAGRLAETAADACASRGYLLLARQAQTVLAGVAAGRGEVAVTQALADEITRWAAPRGLAYFVAGAHYVSGLAALARSEFAAAYEQESALCPAGDIPARPVYAAWAVLDFVEAALRTDRLDEAAAHADAGRRAGLAAVSPRLALLSTAALALTARDEAAPGLFEQALAAGDGARWPFEQARVHLLYGERLRRLRASGLGRQHLGTALAGFRRLGATAWTERTTTALRAAGQARPDRGSRAPHGLTGHELQIARLAAAGLSNKEIGERLFMSHRTVASHLYKMFPKLGITSRAALGQVLPPRNAI